ADLFAAALADTVFATVKPLDGRPDLALERAVVVEHRLIALIFGQRGPFITLFARDPGAVYTFAGANRLLAIRARVDVALHLLQVRREPQSNSRLVKLSHLSPSSPAVSAWNTPRSRQESYHIRLGAS